MKISPPAARGLLKLAIKDEFGPFISLESVNYEEIERAIKYSLSKRLEILEVLNKKRISCELITELNRHQSLITIEPI